MHATFLNKLTYLLTYSMVQDIISKATILIHDAFLILARY